MARWYAGGVATTPRDELVEHVDADGRVIEVVRRGRMRRREPAAPLRRGRRHRQPRRLLVHRRADDKDVFPDGGISPPAVWSVSARATPTRQHRELAEELGVDRRRADVRDARGHHDDEHAREIATCSGVVHDGPFRFDDGEITEARFVTPSELAD